MITGFGLWKKELLERGGNLFEKAYKSPEQRVEQERDQLLKKVGELSMEVDFLKKVYASIWPQKNADCLLTPI